ALKSRIWKLQAKTQPIEERLAEAGEESEKLAAELRALDQAWPTKLAELGFDERAAAAAVTATAETAAEPGAGPAEPAMVEGATRNGGGRHRARAGQWQTGPRRRDPPRSQAGALGAITFCRQCHLPRPAHQGAAEDDHPLNHGRHGTLLAAYPALPPCFFPPQ